MKNMRTRKSRKGINQLSPRISPRKLRRTNNIESTMREMSGEIATTTSSSMDEENDPDEQSNGDNSEMHEDKSEEEDSSQTPGMFTGLKAWFSSSVSPAFHRLWVSHGGKIVKCDDALYLFSQDASASDTKKIYESEAYLHEHLSVFHVSYVKDSVIKGGPTAVPPGDYFLPPPELQATLKAKLNPSVKLFKWETQQKTPNTQGQETKQPSPQQPGPSSSSKQAAQSQTTEPRPGDSPHKSEERFVPLSPKNNHSRSPSSSPEKHKQKQGSEHGQKVQSPQKRKTSSVAVNNNQVETLRHSTETEELPSPVIPRIGPRLSKLSPKKGTSNNKTTAVSLHEKFPDYADISQMPIVDGDLFDFIPGKSGCTVSKMIT